MHGDILAHSCIHADTHTHTFTKPHRDTCAYTACKICAIIYQSGRSKLCCKMTFQQVKITFNSLTRSAKNIFGILLNPKCRDLGIIRFKCKRNARWLFVVK